MITLITFAECIKIALLVIAILLACLGIVGAVLPAIPGTPLSFIALAMAYLLCPGSISPSLLIGLAITAIVVMVLDYIAPIWFTKMGGGSKKAVWYSMIGLVVGLFFLPWGLIVGPLAGAFVGELMSGANPPKALKVSLWSLVSFLLTTGAKLIVGAVLAYYTIAAIFAATF